MLKMINLPYGFEDLEPYYDAETLRIHYDILYKGYVDNTNKLQEKLNLARNTGDYKNIKCLEKELSFQGSGAILHKNFFENIGKPRQTRPSDELKWQIKKDFINFERFKNQFTEASKSIEGSGWTLLVWVS